MARKPADMDDLANQIVALRDADRVRLLSLLKEKEGEKVEWSVIAKLQARARVRETPALHGEFNAAVREVRRARRRSA